MVVRTLRLPCGRSGLNPRCRHRFFSICLLLLFVNDFFFFSFFPKKILSLRIIIKIIIKIWKIQFKKYFISKMWSLLSVDTYIKVFMRLLWVVFRYVLVLNHLRAEDTLLGVQGCRVTNIHVYTSYRKERQNRVVIIIISLFQEDNIFGMNASLTYGPQIQRHACVW